MSVTSAGLIPSGAIASDGRMKSFTANDLKYWSRWNPESTSATRPLLPFNAQIVIAMSRCRLRSAPSMRLETGKFAIVANRTA